MICKKFESSGVPSSRRHAWTPRHYFAVPKSLTQFLTVGSVAFEGAGAHRITPRVDTSERVTGYLAVSARVANGREPRSLLEPLLPVLSGFLCPQNFRPQNHGAVFRGACDQIERKAIPKNFRVFNEFCPAAPNSIIDVERAVGPKLARLRRRLVVGRVRPLTRWRLLTRR